jgi:hypothetical protein
MWGDDDDDDDGNGDKVKCNLRIILQLQHRPHVEPRT